MLAYLQYYNAHITGIAFGAGIFRRIIPNSVHLHKRGLFPLRPTTTQTAGEREKNIRP